MTEIQGKLEICDCQGHLFGPFQESPLSSRRNFDLPVPPIEELETIWQTSGLACAVLVQGSARGDDHAALLATLARSPETMRGVVLLQSEVTDAAFAVLHRKGMRAVRFDGLHLLLASDGNCEQHRLADAAAPLKRVEPLGCHVVVHIDIADLALVTCLDQPQAMPVVIDHMAPIGPALQDLSSQLARLLRALAEDLFWVKVSDADHLTEKCSDLQEAVQTMCTRLDAASERIVWRLDWLPVNLARKRFAVQLTDLMLQAAGSELLGY